MNKRVTLRLAHCIIVVCLLISFLAHSLPGPFSRRSSTPRTPSAHTRSFLPISPGEPAPSQLETRQQRVSPVGGFRQWRTQRRLNRLYRKTVTHSDMVMEKVRSRPYTRSITGAQPDPIETRGHTPQAMIRAAEALGVEDVDPELASTRLHEFGDELYHTRRRQLAMQPTPEEFKPERDPQYQAFLQSADAAERYLALPPHKRKLIRDAAGRGLSPRLRAPRDVYATLLEERPLPAELRTQFASYLHGQGFPSPEPPPSLGEPTPPSSPLFQSSPSLSIDTESGARMETPPPTMRAQPHYQGGSRLRSHAPAPFARPRPTTLPAEPV